MKNKVGWNRYDQIKGLRKERVFQEYLKNVLDGQRLVKFRDSLGQASEQSIWEVMGTMASQEKEVDRIRWQTSNVTGKAKINQRWHQEFELG